MVTPEHLEVFRSMSKKPINEQMKFFLRAFFKDADVDIEEVYLLANYFHFKLGGSEASSYEFELAQASELLQNLGNPMSAIQLKKVLREFDVDNNGKMSFVEFALFYFKKDVDTLLTADIDGPNDLLAALRDAKQKEKELEAEKASKHQKIEELNEIVAAGGVKKFEAQQQIEDIEKNQIPEIELQLREHNKVLIKAQKAVDTAGSDLDKVLIEKKLNHYNTSAQSKLHQKFEKLEPYF